MLYLSFIFQKICTNLYKYIHAVPLFLFPKICTSLYKYIHCTYCNYFQKIWHGEARWWQFQMIKGGVKNESEFFLCSFSNSKLCNFLFLQFAIKLKFFHIFFCSCEFLQENIMKICFVCEQEHGKEKSHYISNTFSLALSFPLYIIEGF